MYYNSWFSLTDIPECSDILNVCDVNAFCIDRDGSFLCICNPGYVGDGRECYGKYKLRYFIIRFCIHKQFMHFYSGQLSNTYLYSLNLKY